MQPQINICGCDSLSKNKWKKEYKSRSAACTATTERFFQRKSHFPEEKISTLQISRPESKGFK